MRVLAAALPIAVIACAPVTEPPAEPAGQALAAPVPAEDAVRVFAEDAGKTIAVPVGTRVSVALIGVPTAGYLWAVAEKPAFLGEPETGGGPTVSAQTKPGYAGGNHWETFTFRVEQAGAGELRLEQRRPWETDEPPANTFSVMIEAK